ncbi:uncharacterized protein [Halyomorpha halys]|uniref:uncharacterized protein n=1 Tax=Halyomorpha halys TaxID=286706 RepID=UPI0006D51E75|nr:uncharacterized protein LOC106692910 [Halyomorpha halys]
MSTVDLSQILVECQSKLVEIDDKLSQIKTRFSPGRTKHKYSLHTNEDFIILKKETDNLEGDIQFVKSLIEESTEIHSSFPLRFMRKVLPTKMFSSQNKNISNETKAKIIAHSTALLEDKVKNLQTIAVTKKKKRKPKRESKDSVVTDTTNSIKPNSLTYRPRASSDSEIFMRPEKIPSLKVLSSLRKQRNVSALNNNSSIETTELRFWADSDISKFLPPNTKGIVPSTIKKTRSQTEYNFTTYSEQHVQTIEAQAQISHNTTDKYVQTDLPLVTWVNAVMNQNKSLKQYVEKETNTDMEPKINPCVSDNIKQIKDSQNLEVLPSLANILDVNEIDNVINSLLYSPLKMLQCKHVNKLSGGIIGNPPGYVNLIIRQSDFMPLLVSGIEERTTAICKQFFPENCIRFAYTYHVKVNTACTTLKYNQEDNCPNIEEECSNISIKQYPTTEYSKKVGKTHFSLHYNDAEGNKKSQVSNTLQIDYKNPQTAGRIILTEFGDSQSSTQPEMISRILSHLIGLPNSKTDIK